MPTQNIVDIDTGGKALQLKRISATPAPEGEQVVLFSWLPNHGYSKAKELVT